MALIERFTPGGNLYPDGSSTFAMLVEFFRRLAENRDQRDTATLNAAAATAISKANTAEGNAKTYTDAATTSVRDTAIARASQAETNAKAYADTVRGDAYEYTDVSFAAAGPGGATDTQVDAAVDRGVLAGRIAGKDAVDQLAQDVLARVSKGELIVSLKDFGAVGDGATDDTAAVQAFVNDITVNGKVGWCPRGRYLITATINIPVRPGWAIRGAHRDTVRFIQATDNIPIFNLGAVSGSALHTYELEGFTLDYVNVQPASNTNAVCIQVSTMPFQGTWRNITFFRGWYGTRVANGIGAPWGHTFDDLTFSSDLYGGAIDWRSSVNAVPNNRFGRIFVDAKNMTDTIFHVRGYNFEIDTIEIIAGYKGPQLFNLAPGGRVNIGSMKIENGTYPAGKRMWETGVNSYASIGHLNISGHTMEYTGGKSYVLWANNGSKIDVGHIELSPTTISGDGAVYVAGGGGTVSIGRTVYIPTGTGAVAGLTDTASSATADTTTVLDHVNGRLSQNKGDANVTVTLGDPNKIAFQTAFTAPRTIDLPNNNTFLFSGLYYEFLFNGAINGANTATIQCGGVTKRVQSTDKAIVGFTYRRHASNARDGWVLTKYETLP